MESCMNEGTKDMIAEGAARDDRGRRVTVYVQSPNCKTPELGPRTYTTPHTHPYSKTVVSHLEQNDVIKVALLVDVERRARRLRLSRRRVAY